MHNRLDQLLIIFCFAMSGVRAVSAFVSSVRSITGCCRRTRRLFALTTTSSDETFMQQAIDHARHGIGHTFPNPAVGCVLVRNDQVIGSGFHPKAGYPHAEVFALLEAAGHVQSGVKAAKAVLKQAEPVALTELIQTYASTNGPQDLFADCLADKSVTAYVTLEPCCHYGLTPPCAVSMALAKVDRVVIGFRDPNPRVDGGGVKVLEQAGVKVEFVEGKHSKVCRGIVKNFVNRITPRTDLGVTGAMRSTLRTLANRKKAERSLEEVVWGRKLNDTDNPDFELADMNAIDNLRLQPEWLEHLDGVLWRDELVSLKLNKAVGKKKLAKQLGERIAAELHAHVAQTVGHTVLLYRPGIPPVLMLEGEVEETVDEV
jgi:pyrimidine deaminase RibD-like protein/RNA-binding protein YhbY